MNAILKKISFVALVTFIGVQVEAAEILTCKADQILVCLPPPACRAGSIGCREAERSATCFCGDKPQVVNEFEENEQEVAAF